METLQETSQIPLYRLLLVTKQFVFVNISIFSLQPIFSEQAGMLNAWNCYTQWPIAHTSHLYCRYPGETSIENEITRETQKVECQEIETQPFNTEKKNQLARLDINIKYVSTYSILTCLQHYAHTL